jgi:hypothetical protein
MRQDVAGSLKCHAVLNYLGGLLSETLTRGSIATMPEPRLVPADNEDSSASPVRWSKLTVRR